MPFEPGNQYGKGNAKAQKLTGVIDRAILQDDGKRIRAGVERLLDLAAQGDLPAMTFIRDTWQGKPQQAIELSGNDEKPLFQAIKMVIVANNPNQINELAQQHGQVIEGELASPMIDPPRGVVPEQGMGVESLGYPSPKVPTEILEPKVISQDG